MIDFEIAQRLVRMQERLRHATFHELRKDGHHKPSEGAMELCFHMPNIFDDNQQPQWSVWAYSYLLCPDGRSERWFGRTPQEAIGKAEDAIDKWCFAPEMEMFAGQFETIPDDDRDPDPEDIPA